MKPLVSVIMPTFNRVHIIGRAIHSVLAQTDPRWELIVMDDGSSDHTAATVQAFADPRIKYYSQPNAGPAAARNHAIEVSSTPWVAHLDSDDQLRPNYIKVMLEHLQQRPKATYASPKIQIMVELYQNHRLIASRDQSGVFPDNLELEDFYHHRVPFYTLGFMHSRHLFEQGARFDPTLPGKDDWDMLMQMGEIDPGGYLYVPEVLADYHQAYGLDGRIGNGSYATRARKLEAIWKKHRHDRLMRGQTWYPAEVEHWDELERQYQAGLIPAANLYEFPEYWPKRSVPVYNRPL